jgi:FKBP-type peptidyl-prolyl cis-trans isomerase (trigger factor)
MNNGSFSSDFIQIGPNLTRAIIKVPADLVKKFYKHAAKNHMNKINTAGFSRGTTPIEYIEQNFKQNILNHLKEFFLKYFVISFLYQEIRTKKIVTAGEPRLTNSFAAQDKDAEYHFEISTIQFPLAKEWKYISFRAPRRKGYKGIDKQATDFLKEERNNEEKYRDLSIQIGDWVNFSVSLIDSELKPVFDDLKETFWLKISSEETSISFQEVFINKKKGEKFYSDHLCFQDFFNAEQETQCNFLIEILSIIHQNYFSTEKFKEHFKIKTNRRAHQKMVEVFSFKDDLSLRRSIIEGTFNTLFHSYHVEAPTPCILRQQQIILDNLQYNPDYAVYKSEPNFHNQVKKLADKQIREAAFMELLAYYEDLEISDQDVENYLNLTQRLRTKDFIHFTHPAIHANQDEYPVFTEPLKQVCLREKALNHAIFHLTKE